MYNKGLFSFYTSLMSQFHSVYTSLDIIVQSKIYSLLVVMLQYLMSVSLKQQEKAISVINLWFMTSMNTFRRVQDPSGFQCTITTYLSIKLLNTINKRVTIQKKTIHYIRILIKLISVIYNFLASFKSIEMFI